MSSCQESSPLGDRQAHIYCVHVCACVCARGWVLEQSAPEGAHRQRGLEGACGMPALGSPAGLASMLGSFFPGRAPSTWISISGEPWSLDFLGSTVGWG